jgi:Mu-like prophage I protein
VTMDIELANFYPIELAADDDGSPKWNTICCTVESKNHAAGDFEITTRMLYEAVDNFKKRSTGKIPIKFDHHSPKHPNYDPRVGSPAQGYVLDMRVVGETQLQGLTKFLATAQKYVKDEQYQWFSPGLNLNSLDRKTGKPVGMRINEVSLVTDPHLYEMPTVRASDDQRGDENIGLTQTSESDTNKEMSKELEQKIVELTNSLREKDLLLRSKDAEITTLSLEHKTKLSEVEVELANKTREYDSLVKEVIDTDVDRAIATYGKSHNLSDDMREDLKAVRLSNPKFFAKQYPVKTVNLTNETKTVPRTVASNPRPAYSTTNLSNETRPDIKPEAKLTMGELYDKYIKEGLTNLQATVRAAKEINLL